MHAGMSSVEMQNCMFHTSLVGVNSHVRIFCTCGIHAAGIVLIIMLSEFDSCLGMSMNKSRTTTP